MVSDCTFSRGREMVAEKPCFLKYPTAALSAYVRNAPSPSLVFANSCEVRRHTLPQEMRLRANVSEEWSSGR